MADSLSLARGMGHVTELDCDRLADQAGRLVVEHISIDGPKGKIEAQLRLSDSGSGEFSLLCHPHPLYGGSMDDVVLTYIDAALEARDVSSLRFNFRGVGASTGVHDKGVGEVDDLHYLGDWLRENHNVNRLIVCGYSFGAIVALKALGALVCDTAGLDHAALLQSCLPYSFWRKLKSPQPIKFLP